MINFRGLLFVAFFTFAFVSLAYGHDHNHPELDDWYASLMQPDAPHASCCGKADAYWCDDYYARDGRAFCKITDDRPDAPLNRPHIPLGTEIEIPPNKLKWDRANPTGHAVIFVRGGAWGPGLFTVFCFVQGTGI
ncbi:hypothetical protein ABIF26_006476 [Bradyrhizobium elkanii]|uniref:hypothetical protein n=1 Tax=Bradyrhizobium elkanii TaxID=29448 RepID=UPI00216A6743|nr:hypothetical protein [Bradyrhizobium elkanii]